jgi:2-polyprenyl-3-methyl-5-hydroxy-6-metoxy-1,4-benzoquinol methylase
MTSEERRPVTDDVSAHEYASIAEQYETSFQKMPFRTYVEQPAFLNTVGDVTGLRLLDVACGTGFYSRLLRRRGASQVVGVDVSLDMVQYAQKVEAAEPLGMTYLVRDVGTMEVLDTFDMVVGVYLLHYATTFDHLKRMCQCMADNLAVGGRLVTNTINPGLSVKRGYYLPYGIEVYAENTPMEDGTQYAFSFSVAAGLTPPLTIHYWSAARLEEALTAARFTDIHLQPAVAAPDGIAQMGEEFWTQHDTAPFTIVISATRK